MSIEGQARGQARDADRPQASVTICAGLDSDTWSDGGLSLCARSWNPHSHAYRGRRRAATPTTIWARNPTSATTPYASAPASVASEAGAMASHTPSAVDTASHARAWRACATPGSGRG